LAADVTRESNPDSRGAGSSFLDDSARLSQLAAALWCLGVAVETAGRIAQSAGVARWINRALGGLFIHLGLRIALFQARSL
jgi:threonine/homoserine/homoserine lactone efflux protein